MFSLPHVVPCFPLLTPSGLFMGLRKKGIGTRYRGGIAEVMGSNTVEALIFFRLLLSNCLNWKIHCDDHSSLSYTTAVQI